MKLSKRKAQARAQRRRDAAQGLNWCNVSLVILCLVLVFLFIWMQPPEQPHVEKLQRVGSRFLLGRRRPSIGSLLHAATGGAVDAAARKITLRVAATLLGNESSLFLAARWPTTPASSIVEVKQFVARHDALAFVPDVAALSIASTSQAGFKEALESLVARRKDDRVRSPVLALALTAILERHLGNASAHASWLQDLFKAPLPFSYQLSKDQREGLRGTSGEHIVAEHDALIEAVIDVASDKSMLPFFRAVVVQRDEAAWGIGVALHHGLVASSGEGLVLMPGFIDGVRRHWNPDVCAEPMRVNPAARQVPGFALVANRDHSFGDDVWYCSGRMTNAQLLTTYGVIHTDNPHGPVMRQNLPEHTLAEVSQVADRAKCKSEEISNLFLQHVADAVLTEDNVRCNSLLWMENVDEALTAMKAGYFAKWPRPAQSNITTAGDPLASASARRWRRAEAAMYRAVGKECNRSLETLLKEPNDEVLRRLQASVLSDQLSAAVLVVRSRSSQLYANCVRWSTARADALNVSSDGTSDDDSIAARMWSEDAELPATHTEL